jgi:hypothetical protein
MPGGGCVTTGQATCPTVTSTAAVNDPYQNVTTPTCSGTGGVSGTTYSPGNFASAVTVSKASTFSAGKYCFQKGLTIQDKASITGTGVLLVMDGGSLSMSGKSSADVTGPTTGNYQGFVFWQPQSNTTADSPVGNNINSYYRGIWYSPGATVQLNGSGVMNAFQLIANGVAFGGASGGLVVG